MFVEIKKTCLQFNKIFRLKALTFKSKSDQYPAEFNYLATLRTFFSQSPVFYVLPLLIGTSFPQTPTMTVFPVTAMHAPPPPVLLSVANATPSDVSLLKNMYF